MPVAPSTATSGEHLTIRGLFGFRAQDFQDSGAQLKVDGQTMSIVYYSPLVIVAEVPADARTTTSNVIVSMVQGGIEIPLGNITWLANVPTITSIEPQGVLKGMSITIRGTGLTDIAKLSVLDTNLPIVYQSANVVVARFEATPLSEASATLVVTRASSASPLPQAGAFTMYPLPTLSFTGTARGNVGTKVQIALSQVTFGSLTPFDGTRTGRLGLNGVHVGAFAGSGLAEIEVQRPVYDERSDRLTISFSNGIVISSAMTFSYAPYPSIVSMSSMMTEVGGISTKLNITGRNLLCGSQLDQVVLGQGQTPQGLSIEGATAELIRLSLTSGSSDLLELLQLVFVNGCTLRLRPRNYRDSAQPSLTQFSPSQVVDGSRFNIGLSTYPSNEPVLFDRAATVELYTPGSQAYTGQAVAEPMYARVEVYRPSGRLTTVKDDLILLPATRAFELVPAAAYPGELVTLKGLNMHTGSRRVVSITIDNVEANVEAISRDGLMLRLPLGLPASPSFNIELEYDDGGSLAAQTVPYQVLAVGDSVLNIAPSTVQAGGTITFLGTFTASLSGYRLEVPHFLTVPLEASSTELGFRVLGGTTTSTTYRLVYGEHDRLITTEAEHAITFKPAPTVTAIVEEQIVVNSADGKTCKGVGCVGCSAHVLTSSHCVPGPRRWFQ